MVNSMENVIEEPNIRLQIKIHEIKGMSIFNVNKISQFFNACASISEVNNTGILNISTKLTGCSIFFSLKHPQIYVLMSTVQEKNSVLPEL